MSGLYQYWYRASDAYFRKSLAFITVSLGLNKYGTKKYGQGTYGPIS